MPTISISQEVYEELKKRSKSWEDTPTKIIARLLELSTSSGTQDIPGNSQIEKTVILENTFHSPRKPSDHFRDKTTPSTIIKKMIMLVLADEGLDMIDPQKVKSETKRLMKINDLLTKPDLETTPSGRARLETRIERLQREFIDEGLAESAEGCWLLTSEGLKECIETKRDSRLLMGNEKDLQNRITPKITYRHTRLCFIREKIESLEAEDAFRIICNDGIFQMTKNEFYEVFYNIVSTNSYQHGGLYHSPRPPRKAMQFKIL